MPSSFNMKSFLEAPTYIKRPMVFKADTVIFKQGDPATAIYYLIEGRAKQVVTAGNGKEAVTDVLEAGDFFGTAAIAGARTRPSTVTAMAVCRVAILKWEATRRAIIDHPEFTQLLLYYLLTRNYQIEADKVDLMLNSTEQRLASKLVELSNIRSGVSRVLDQAIDPAMLADMIGASHSHVHQFIKKFRALSLIDSKGGIRVLPALLQVVIANAEGKNEQDRESQDS